MPNDDYATYSKLTELPPQYIFISFDLDDNWTANDDKVHAILDRYSCQLDSGAGFGRRDHEGVTNLPTSTLDSMIAELNALNLPNAETWYEDAESDDD